MPPKAPINPADKSTVFSIFPREIVSFKPTITPGQFYILPGSYDKPSRLVVGTSSWYRDIDPDRELLEMVDGSIRVANSIVTDYCNGLMECDMGDAMPGLFFLPGDISIPELKTQHASLLERIKQRQFNWYKKLIGAADAIWARSGGNPLAVSDLQRMAANELQMKDKPWITNVPLTERSNCPACGLMVDPQYAICANCKHVINPERAKELGIKVG